MNASGVRDGLSGDMLASSRRYLVIVHFHLIVLSPLTTMFQLINKSIKKFYRKSSLPVINQAGQIK